MGYTRRQQGAGASFSKTSLRRSLSRGSGTFKREQSMRDASDVPLLSPCIIMSPTESELVACVSEAVKDILTVTAWGARALSSYPEVKAMLRDMFGKSLGLSPSKTPISQLTQDKLQTLPGLGGDDSVARDTTLSESPSKGNRTLSFNVDQRLHKFIDEGRRDSNASASMPLSPLADAYEDDEFDADDPLGILKGKFGGGFQSSSHSAPRVSSMRAGSLRNLSAANPSLPISSPFEVIKRVLGRSLGFTTRLSLF